MSSALTGLRGWARRNALLVDAAFAGALFAAALISQRAMQVAVPEESVLVVDLPMVVGLAMTIVPLAWRRRFPIGSAVACCAGFVLSRQVLGAVEASVVAVTLSLSIYSLSVGADPRWRRGGGALCALLIGGELIAEVVIEADPVLLWAFVIAYNVALFLAMWALGGAVRSSRSQRAELTVRTRELEVEREENARRAVLDERVRIARELHDVVAHHVSVIGVQAGAARTVIAHDPAAATDALGAIERESREAVTELHRLLAVLRTQDDVDSLAPAPGLAQLPALAGAVGQAGLDVRVTIEGTARALPPTVDVSAFRIVQEALTNAIKHSGASTARVLLRYGSGDLELRIEDDGTGGPYEGADAGAGGEAASTSTGLGLAGMRERAGLHGGAIDAGPTAAGGFAIRAVLPAAEVLA